jgi:hypothetical protein
MYVANMFSVFRYVLAAKCSGHNAHEFSWDDTVAFSKTTE